MSTLALQQAQWQPQRPGGFGVGALLALLAHGVLVVVLALGVAWRSRPSDVVMSAELWSAVPQVAAPAPVEPPPPPRPVERPTPPTPDPRIEQQRIDAQIAIEKAEKKKKLEKEQEEKLKEEKLKEEKLKEEKRKKELAAKQAAAKEAEEKLAKQREENLARIRGMAGASGPATATGQALRDAAPSASYAGRIMARIKPNIVLTGDVPDSVETTVEVKCAPDGRITSRRIIKSTGNALWEEAVLRAIDKAEILPRDTDGRVPPSFPIVFKRKE